MAERNLMKKVKLLYFANSYPWPGGQIVIFEQVYEDLSKMEEIAIKKTDRWPAMLCHEVQGYEQSIVFLPPSVLGCLTFQGSF